MSKIVERLRKRAEGQELGTRNAMIRAAAFIDVLEADRIKFGTVKAASETVLAEICDGYCKFADYLDEGALEEKCGDCPLIKLQDALNEE